MIYVKDANLNLTWKEIETGGTLLKGGTSLEVNTGDWRIMIPKWNAEKCIHCMLCFCVCADSAIPAKSEKRADFDFKHCKGCGVCYKHCPLFKKPDVDKAITWEKEEK
jgi:pyruvate ferredoxin oxidoreductase delta subunit